MFDSDEDFRKGRASSLLGFAPARPVLGEDAALRHERARLRRERKASPLLAVPMPMTRPAPPPAEPEVEIQPRPEPRRPLRDRIAGRPVQPVEPAFEPEEERPQEPPAAADAPASAPLEWADRPADRPAGHATPAAMPARPRRPVSGRTRRTIVGLTLAGVALGAALALAWPKSYVATSEMLIDPRGTQPAGAAPLSPDAAFALVDNQLRVLRSGTMLEAVAERLNLAADPEFNGGGGSLARLGDLVAGDGAGAPEGRRRHVVEALARAVRAERVGGASVVTVSADTSDPQKSALIANTISELFLSGFGHAPANAGEAAGEMAARLAELRAGVEEAERAVEAYKAENGLVDAQGRLITDDEIVRLGEQLSAARARTVELNARAASTKEADVDSIVTGSLPEQYASPTLADLRTRHAELKQQLDRLSVKLGPRHPERLATQAEVEGARQEISGELRRVAAALQTELRRAVQQEQELASQLAQMKVRQGDIGDELVALRELEREAEARRSAYGQSLRMMAAGGSAAGSVSMISRAEPPLQASGPSVAGFSLAGGLAGLLAGLGYAGWRRKDDEPDRETDAAQITETGEEADQMYPYSPYAQQAPYAQQPHAQPVPAGPVYQQPAPQPFPQPAPYPAGYVQPAAPGWQHAAQPPMPVPAWPVAHYPAPPMPAYAPMPQQMMMPAPVPHDPWAHLRAYSAPPPPPVYAGPAYAPPPVQTVVYVPAPPVQPAQPPAPAPAAAEPRQEAPRPAPRRQPEERPDHHAPNHHAFVDERTDAAIEEIRRSLREFREAIEDYAGEHDTHRRYGT